MADYLSNPASAPYRKLIERISSYHAFPSGLLGNLVQKESRFNPKAVSPAGAVGLVQLMPIHDTVDREDPVASLQYGAKYLAEMHKRFGNWEEALAAYNWGPTNVARAKRKYGDDWLKYAPAETQDYVATLRPAKTEPFRGPAPGAMTVDALLAKYGDKK